MAQIFDQAYATWDALERLFKAAAWPAAPDGSKGIIPGFVFVGSYGDVAPPLEHVFIETQKIPIPTDWKTSGFTRDQKFTTKFAVNSSLRDRTNAEVRARMKQLTNIVEGVVQKAIMPVSQGGVTPFEFTTAAWWWGIVDWSLGVGPNPDGGGQAGSAEFTLAVTARIGGI